MHAEGSTNQLQQTQPDGETGALPFKPETAKPVYHVLAEHQVTDEEWELKELAAWLQLWTTRFDAAFQLGLNEISLCIDWLPVHCYGHFRHGMNGFGLKGEVAINRRHLHAREPWNVLGTLLHELIHAWQELYGKPGKHNYHNREFRENARPYGLVIDQRGHTQYAPGSPFFRLLEEHGVEFPKVPPVEYVVRGDSKLKKWSCRCDPPINVRVAVPHFYAQCLWCGQVFQKQD